MKKLTLTMLSVLLIASACKKSTTASKASSVSYLSFTVPKYEFKDPPNTAGFSTFPSTLTFKLTVSSKNTTGTFTYDSSDKTVATIVAGTVTMLKAGTTKITVSQAAANGFDATFKTITLTVPTASAGTAGVLNPILYGGGKIFDVDATGVHGLIAAKTNITQSGTGNFIYWSSAAFNVPNTNNTDGYTNTQNIIQAQTANNSAYLTYAALMCKNLGTGWYLPAKSQLETLNGKKTEVGGFTSGTYWSSTQYDVNYAWYTLFTNIGSNNGKSFHDNDGGHGKNKTEYYEYVRAIRSF